MANNNDKFISRENAKTLWGYMIDLLTGKQNKLTFDDTPTQSSDNPVKSGGIFTALAGKGTYSKPQNGIPKTDLENAVQTSLGLADSALQSETDPTVPSWAKATNKPSYNSDEISDTNREHKFATQSQLNQISTNQTNILYGLNTGVKNKLPCKIFDNNQSNDTGLKCNYNEDGTYTVTGTKSTSDSYLDIKNIYADKLNGDHVAYISVTGTGTCQIAAYGWNGTEYTLMLSTSTSQGFNIGNYAYALFRIRFMDSVGTSYNATVKAMVCTMEAWNQSHDWQPPALPNQDLTVLEAEDRAAIAEIINNGTKNLWNFPDASYESINKITVTDNSDGSKTFTSGNGNWQRAVYKLNVPTTGRYYLAFSVKNSSLTSSECYIFAAPAGDSSNPRYGSIQITGDGKYHTAFNVTGDLYIWVYLNYGAGTELNSITLYNVMLCTMTDCNVTDAVVPYNTRQWQYIEKSFTSTAANTYEYSGVSFDVPANQVYEFYAIDRKEGAEAKGILVADNSTNVVMPSEKTTIAENNQTYTTDALRVWQREVSGLTGKYHTNLTYYVWVKRGAAAANTIVLAYRRIY